MRCPKCRFEQAEGAAECLRCGVLFARVAEAARESEEGEGTLYRPSPPPPTIEADEPASRHWRALLLEEEKEADPFRFWARTALAAILLLWGCRFLFSTVADNAAGESFLHWINLPFHEAGHVIFGFFGDFVRALGGTLGQLLIPAICLGAFLFRQRDPFAASVALWWLAENFLDIAPYIADAQSGQLLLLGGVTGRDVPGYHDWENILIDLNLLAYDRTLGAIAFAIGRLLLLASFLWGGALLRRQWRALRAASPAGER